MYVPYVCPSTWRTEQQDQHFTISFSGLYAFPVDPNGNAKLAEFWARPQEIPLAQCPVLNPANPPLLPPGWAVCSPRQLATNCRLAPHILCRGSSKPWSLVCSTGAARGKGQLFSKRCGWRTRGMEGSSRLRHNSSTVTKFKHTKFKDPSLCFVSTQSCRPLERRQLRICQEDGKVRYAARALTDSPTAKDFPYRGGDARWRHWWSFCSFALTIMYWFALRNLPCFFCATLMGPFLHKGIRLSLL